MWTHNIGIQMKLKELTKTFMMLIEKKTLVVYGLHKNILTL